MSELTTTPSEQKSDFLSRPLLAVMSLDWEKVIYITFIVLAIITRFWDLGSRVMSHDESLHTQYSYQFYDGQGFAHTPLMHGPFLFHITAVSYWLLGDSDFAARAPVALFGVLLVVLPYLLRRWIGRVGALFASFIFLISPYVVYYSRYIRHDVYVIVWALIIVISMWFYLRDREEKYLWWFAAGNALMFSTKEVSFIYVAIFGSFLALRLFGQVIAAKWLRSRWAALRMPLLVVALGLVLAAGGFLVERAATAVPTTATPTETSEGFALDPNAATTAATQATDERHLGGWIVIGGISVLIAGLLLIVNALRPHIDKYPEFDLIMLFSTLLLPLVSPLFTFLAGWNPRDYSYST
ncbi:MAG: TIGR03663 family protein, partial [Anaerolineales bacterium]|nr:TIGR03663 family protein [Anaerolineales bacterium]